MHSADKLHDIAQAMVSHVPQMAALGLEFVAMEPGKAIFALPYHEKLIGFPDSGVIAGGTIYTLMDSVSGMAVFSRLGALQPIATLDMRIDYLKPATPGETVYGQAECYKLTRRIAFVRGVAYHEENDNAIAYVSGTFMIGAGQKNGGGGKAESGDIS